MKCMTVVSMVSLMFFGSSPAIAAEHYDAEVKCHQCKENDLSLVEKHKLIGFDGCYDCHDEPIEKKPPNKEKDEDEKKEG